MDKPPPLDFLRTFLAVYRAGTFTGAAKLLGITQPSVTNHIGALERQLGRDLFARTPTGVVPTAHAHDMAVAIGDQLDHLDRFFLDEFTGAPPLRTIHLGGPAEFGTGCLIPALAGVELPRLEMTFGLAEDLLADLVAGRLDLAISTIRPREPSLTAVPVADEEFWLVGAPGFGPPTRHLADLEARPVVAFSRTLPLVRRYWTTVFDRQPEPTIAAVLPNLFAVKAAVLHGFGMSVLPSYLVADEVRAGRLRRLHEPPVHPVNTLFLAARTAELHRHTHLRAVAATIVDAVRRHQDAITP